MIISPDKVADQKERAKYLHLMRECLKDGHISSAKAAGAMAAYLKERISTHDYSEDDALRKKYPFIDFDTSYSHLIPRNLKEGV